MAKYVRRGRYYEVYDSRKSRVTRPNRIAAGMTKQGGFKSDDARKLAVYGTLDSLAGILNWNTKRSPRICSCCRQRMNTVVLSDHGRSKLVRIRSGDRSRGRS